MLAYNLRVAAFSLKSELHAYSWTRHDMSCLEIYFPVTSWLVPEEEENSRAEVKLGRSASCFQLEEAFYFNQHTPVMTYLYLVFLYASSHLLVLTVSDRVRGPTANPMLLVAHLARDPFNALGERACPEAGSTTGKRL